MTTTQAFVEETECTPPEWLENYGSFGAQLSRLTLYHETLAVDCPFVAVQGNVRLYYRVEAHAPSFNFMAVEPSKSNAADDLYAGPNIGVSVLFHGWAAFDGVRYLSFGHRASDNEGELSYPNPRDLVAALLALSDLEARYTRAYEPGVRYSLLAPRTHEEA